MAEGAAGIHNHLEALRDRKGVSVFDLWELFPDDDHAEAWLCWPDGAEISAAWIAAARK